MIGHPVTFSDRAIKEARTIMLDQGLDNKYALRVTVGKSGCGGGTEPVLGFDTKKEDDVSYEISGITIIVRKKDLLFLAGKHVEYHEVEDVTGFQFLDGKPES